MLLQEMNCIALYARADIYSGAFTDRHISRVVKRSEFNRHKNFRFYENNQK